MAGILSDVGDVVGVIDSFFQAGKTKDLAHLRKVQLDCPEFSSFSDMPPYDLKDFATSVALQELRFVSISDYDYEIRNPSVSVFGNTAVAAFGLRQSGMLVDNKAFTGEHMVMESRATFVLVKRPDWRIVHIHFSRTSR